MPCRAVKPVVKRGGKAVRICFEDGHGFVVKIDGASDDVEKPVISAAKRTMAFVGDALIDASYQVPAFAFVYRDGQAVAFKGREGNATGREYSGGRWWSCVAGLGSGYHLAVILQAATLKTRKDHAAL
jgi:hypothetical protein